MRQLTLKIRCITFLLQSLIKINLVLRFNNKLNMLDSRVTQKISENTLYSLDFKHMTNVCSQNCTGSTKQTSWEPYRPTYRPYTKTKETYNIIVPPYYCLWAITSQRLYFIGTKVLSLKLTEK